MASPLRRPEAVRTLPAESGGAQADPRVTAHADADRSGSGADGHHERAASSDLSSKSAAADRDPEHAASADRVRLAAFEAGLLGVAAATAYALLLVLLRTSGEATATAIGCCALLLGALALAARHPAATFATLRRRPAAGLVLGALAGIGLAAVGPDNRLLFLPALLLVSTLGGAAGPRRTILAAALATAGLLAPLASDPAAVGDRRLLALTALGLLTIPPLLAALIARASRAGEPPTPHAPAAAEPPPDPAPPSMTVDLWVQETHKSTLIPAGRSAPAAPSVLTPRQLEAVALTAAGLRHAEIAERLGVSIHQVRRLLRQGRERVHASTTRELVAWAMIEGIVGPPKGTETQSRPSND